MFLMQIWLRFDVRVDGVLEQWIDMEADENVQDAQAMDAILVDN